MDREKFKNCSIPKIYERKMLVAEMLKDGANVHELNGIVAALSGYIGICEDECGERPESYCTKRRVMIKDFDDKLRIIAMKKLSTRG